MAPCQDALAPLRCRAATEVELAALSLRTGGALVVEAVPASLAELKAGDVLAFSETIALTSLDELKGAVKAAGGKAIDLLFYRSGKAELATLVLKPEMLEPPPREKPVDKTEPQKPLEPTRPVATIPATKFAADQWTFLPSKASGSLLAEGGMHLRYAKGQGDGAAREAARNERITGDFELVVHYEMVDWQADKMISSGFGIRLESSPGWAGDRIVTFDRIGRKTSDRVVAGTAERQDDELAVQPKTNRGYLRVRRIGDTWRFASRDAGSNDAWTELGELLPKLSPDVGLWMTAHGVGPGETRVLVRDVTIGKLAK